MKSEEIITPAKDDAHSILKQMARDNEMDGYEKMDLYNQSTIDKLAHHYYEILKLTGENPDREGLLKTPQRVAKALQFLTHGYDLDPREILRSAMFAEDYRQMVLVKDIEVYSMCEHHMLPFYGKCAIGYISKGKVLGVSKLARIVDMFARRLQIQERMTEQIADAVMTEAGAEGVGVVIRAKHLCMMMRGVEKQNSEMTTSAVLGSFRSDEKVRQEFLSLI